MPYPNGSCGNISTMISTSPERTKQAASTKLQVHKGILLLLVAAVCALLMIEEAARTRQFLKYGSATNTIYTTATTVDADSGLIVPKRDITPETSKSTCKDSAARNSHRQA